MPCTCLKPAAPLLTIGDCNRGQFLGVLCEGIIKGTLTVRNGDVYMSTYEYFNEWETDDDWWYEVRKVWKDVTTDHVVWDKEHKAFRFVFRRKTKSLGMYNIIYDQFEDQLVLEDCESRIKWGDKKRTPVPVRLVREQWRVCYPSCTQMWVSVTGDLVQSREEAAL